MRNICLLLKVQIQSFFGKSSKRKIARRAGKLGALIFPLLLGALILYFGYFYSKEMFAPFIDLSDLIPVMIAMSALIDLFYNFYATSNVLYGTKDYEMISAMPIKNYEIVISKFLYMAVSSFAFNLLITAGGVIACNELGYVFTLDMVLRLILICLFSVFVPLCIAVIIGALISFVSSFFIKKNLIQTFLYIALIFGVMALSFSFGYNSVGEDADPTKMIRTVYFLFPWVVQGLNSWEYTLLFIGVSLASVVFLATIVCLTYKKMNSILTAKRTKRNYKLKEYKGKSVFGALYKRETKRLFSCAVYFVNSLVSVFMVLIIGIALIVIISLLKDEGVVIVGDAILIYAPTLFAFSFMMSPTTVNSISLEGSAFWIVRTSPVSPKQMFNSKLAVNLTYNGSVALIFSIILAVCMNTTFLFGLFLVLTAVGISILGGNVGLIYNLLFPKMKWDNENQVVKRGGAVFASTFTAMGLAGIFGFVAYKVSEFATLFMGITALIVLMLSLATYIYIIYEGDNLLRKKGL